MFSFAPYQPFMFSTDKKISGIAIQFHSDFYCIHRNPKETNCDTVLFNNIYQPPFIKVDKESEESFSLILEKLKSELKNVSENDYELLVPYLKIFLVTASRIKSQSKKNEPKITDSKTPYILRSLKNVIEENFKEKHSASDYATLLNISPNALAKIVKTHFNKTLTDLITERIIVEAKRELYMTSKPIKEIAFSLGYNDEFYFSRMFKSNTDISPQTYRDTVGFAKAELN
ncbi:Probable transcriptional regulator, AraC family [Flavobacterium indicum GPTSA100-9 = DSM 17447]|uniref:Probable transcriptional regulator, AraC family n=1 Tax=Flavobacterium indicum (strain DSM 17447 / CIP 109464 / GPTSA100-9) TaxID=1094466 RepID=H8XTM3_FLAIG|nr:AraC family transcriptional regulator [Flavobacterium indicum]CCG53603.1 Probable transcriptional regulator, AraC family [Flavobacterium indicum GPTSA100-9 = DSM 17447]